MNPMFTSHRIQIYGNMIVIKLNDNHYTSLETNNEPMLTHWWTLEEAYKKYGLKITAIYKKWFRLYGIFEYIQEIKR